MAVGRQDYQAGVVPIKSGYSLVQSPYFDNDVAIVYPAAATYFCEYTVPVGYQLIMCGYRITSSLSYVNVYTILVEGAVVLQSHFDMEITDNFPDNSPIRVDAAQSISIRVYNDDTKAHTCAVTLFGYLEQIES